MQSHVCWSFWLVLAWASNPTWRSFCRIEHSSCQICLACPRSCWRRDGWGPLGPYERDLALVSLLGRASIPCPCGTFVQLTSMGKWWERSKPRGGTILIYPIRFKANEDACGIQVQCPSKKQYWYPRGEFFWCTCMVRMAEDLACGSHLSLFEGS